MKRVHVAAYPAAGVQVCRDCRVVLIRVDQSTPNRGALYYPVGTSVVVEDCFPFTVFAANLLNTRVIPTCQHRPSVPCRMV